jgi:hypothetical protein
MKGTIFLEGVIGKSLIALAVISVLLALGACTYGTSYTATTATPTISIGSPSNGATVTAGDVLVTVSVSNFDVVDKQGQPNVAGQGHVHFYLDVAAPTTPGQPAVPTSGVWAHVSGLSYTFPNIGPGSHTIAVQLVNNDHTPVVPSAIDSITINVAGAPAAPAAAPTISITSPANGAALPQGNITVNAAVTNFNVVDKQGQANVPGEGHLHFYLDVAAPTTPNQAAVPASGVWAHVSGTSYTFPNVGPGSHTIAVQLVNNDHTPVIPPVVSTITVNVASSGSAGGYGGNSGGGGY